MVTCRPLFPRSLTAVSLAWYKKDLRQAGLRVDVYPDHSDRFGKQFGYANDRDIPFVCVLAPDEFEDGVVAVKNMKSGDQQEIDREEIGENLAKIVLKHRGD